MNLLKHLTKAVRWVASSVSGKKGRDIVDKYGPLVESCLTSFIPALAIYPEDIIKAEVSGWARDRGVPLEDLEAFVAVVRQKAGKS